MASFAVIAITHKDAASEHATCLRLRPPHRTKEKLEHSTRPIKVGDQLPHDGAMVRFDGPVRREGGQRRWHHVMLLRLHRPFPRGDLPQPDGARFVDLVLANAA